MIKTTFIYLFFPKHVHLFIHTQTRISIHLFMHSICSLASVTLTPVTKTPAHHTLTPASVREKEPSFRLERSGALFILGRAV